MRTNQNIIKQFRTIFTNLNNFIELDYKTLFRELDYRLLKEADNSRKLHDIKLKEEIQLFKEKIKLSCQEALYNEMLSLYLSHLFAESLYNDIKSLYTCQESLYNDMMSLYLKTSLRDYLNIDYIVKHPFRDILASQLTILRFISIRKPLYVEPESNTIFTLDRMGDI